MFEGLFAPSHLIIVAIVIVALFGYNKLPDVTRSVGRSLRIFKTEMKGLSEDDKVRDEAEEHGQVTVAPSVAPVTVQKDLPASPVVATPAPVAVAPAADAAPSDDEVARAQAVLAAAAKARAESTAPVGLTKGAVVAPEHADTAAH